MEIAMACVILALLALAGMTALYQTGAGLALQKHRSMALAVANSRLEEVRATPFSVLTALISKNYNTNFIRKVSGQFALGSNETVFIGGRLMSMSTTLQYADADGGSASYDYLRVTASVPYPGVRDVVTLQTLRGP